MAEVQAVKELDTVRLVSHLLERRCSKQMSHIWNIGLNLAKELERKGYRVKLIELNSKRAEYISDEVHNTVVLNGNTSDANLLIQENIEGADVFCAVTDSGMQ